MPDEHENEKLLKRAARGVSAVPPGMDRWRLATALQAEPTQSWHRFGLLRSRVQIALATTALGAVTTLALVAYHFPHASPSPAHENPSASLTVAATPSDQATSAPTETTAPTPTPTPTPRATPIPSFSTPAPTSQGQVLSLTYANHSQNYVVRVGTTINVHLAVTDKFYSWTLPIAKNEASSGVPQLTRTSAQSNPDGSVDATFVATSAGPKVIIVSWADGHSTSGTVDFGVGITVTS